MNNNIESDSCTIEIICLIEYLNLFVKNRLYVSP